MSDWRISFDYDGEGALFADPVKEFAGDVCNHILIMVDMDDSALNKVFAGDRLNTHPSVEIEQRGSEPMKISCVTERSDGLAADDRLRKGGRCCRCAEMENLLRPVIEDQGKHAIVRTYEIMTVGFENDKPRQAFGQVIDTDNMDGSGRKLSPNRPNKKGSLNDIEGSDVVGNIDDRCFRHPAENAPFEPGGIVICVTEVGSQGDERHGVLFPDKLRFSDRKSKQQSAVKFIHKGDDRIRWKVVLLESSLLVDTSNAHTLSDSKVKLY